MDPEDNFRPNSPPFTITIPPLSEVLDTAGAYNRKMHSRNLSDMQEDEEEGGHRLEGRSRLLDDHPELDFLTDDFRVGLVGPPQLQDDQHVSEEYVKRVEIRMNRVVLPKYGGSESEQPPTIYKVPAEMKFGNEEAFHPAVVEIGPFDRERTQYDSRRNYKLLEDYKWCCVRRLISRHHLLQEPARTPALLRRCLDAMKMAEPRIRASYPRILQPPYGLRQDLLRSMLLDGCFVLHRLLKYARIARREEAAAAAASSGAAPPAAGGGTSGDDEEDDDWTQVFGRCWVWGFVTCDLLMLENQIPFFVIQKLFEQFRTDPDETSDVLVVGALRLFRSLRPQMLHSSPIACRDVHHLLHLFYLSVGLPPSREPSLPGDPRRHAVPSSELPQWVPCARELEVAGVRFRARKGAASFLDVRFHGGILEIPALQLYDYSESLLRNLIAFEQTYPFAPGHFTAYAIFMDCLVTSPEDMRLLHHSGVLVNQMNGGERDAVGFFGRLCHEAHLASDRNYLSSVIGDINRYQMAMWPRWRTALVRSYFSNPWAAISLAAAVFLLALTVLQSFFAAYAYFKPPKQP
ncbi:unnamed protein product [Urochloa decumbens]|uniref:Uncharacterized protein n=1 Tax=Urochloa decumbens TaxID=240449 RepID=A0ABC9AK00_9POAL